MIGNKHLVVHIVPKSSGDPLMIPSMLTGSRREAGTSYDFLNSNITPSFYQQRWKSIGGSPMESHQVNYLKYDRSSSLELRLHRGIFRGTILHLPASPAEDLVSQDPLNIAVAHSDVGLQHSYRGISR